MCNCKLKTRSKTRSLIMKKRERARYKSSLPTNWLLFNANMKPLFQTPIPFSISCSHPLPSATPVDLIFLAAGPLRGPPFAGMAMHAVYGISGRGNWRATIVHAPDNNSQRVNIRALYDSAQAVDSYWARATANAGKRRLAQARLTRSS